LESPHLDLKLTPAATGLANAEITLTAPRAEFDLSRFKPGVGRVSLSDLTASTALPLSPTQSQTIHLRASCAQVRVSTGEEILAPSCDISVDLSAEFAQIKPRSLVGTVETVVVNGLSFQNTLVHLSTDSSPIIQTELTTRAIGADWRIEGAIEPKLGQGSLAVEGALTPFVAQQVEEKIGRPTGSILRLSAPAPLSFSVELGTGWQPRKVLGHISAGPVVAGSVPVDAFDSDFSYDHNELSITDIVLSQGENLARGIYWMNTKSLDYRFLLTGHLRPIGISGWFGAWWPGFWNHFDFAHSGPDADVTVDGTWGKPNTTIVFVGADVAHPKILKVAFDRVQTIMFIRPDFYAATELKVTQGNRSAQGTFTRAVDLTRDTDALRFMDFDLTSNLDLAETAKIFGREGAETVEPFTFSNPPSLQLIGHVDGAASAVGFHRFVRIGLESQGPFSLFEFPLDDLSFHGIVRDHDIDLNDVQASFAHGQVLGRAYISGSEADRRLSFDCAIEGANIGDTINTLEQFFAKQRGEAPPAQSKFQQQITAGHLNLHLAAQGLYSNPLSFNGQGEFELGGAQLARINLLGALSQVLSFATLELNTAHSSFSLDRQQLEFPDLKISGSATVIEANGTFLLDKKLMDFNAKVYPFGQGKTLLANAVGFVLVPISNALSLKLSGALDRPNWRFAKGPTNFLYNITGTKPNEIDQNQPAPETTQKLPPFYLRR
jgi:hypothetical protein